MVKFLVVRFSSIGDIVLTSPIVRCLKQQVEGAEVHFLTKKAFEPLVMNNPYIDKVHCLENDFPALIAQLKTQQFDYIIDLHKNLRTARLRQSLRRMAFTFDKLNLKKWLAVRLKYNTLPKVHIVDRYFDAVRLFDVVNDNKGLDFFPVDAEWSPGESTGLEPGRYSVLVLGAKHATKQMPLDLMMDLCEGIKGKLVLVGGKDEMELASKLANQSGTCINLVGKLSIDQSAIVISHSKVVIAPDTGMMHIAAAYKKDILSVWGNTIPDFGMYPYLAGSSSKIFEVEGLGCRPCSKIGYPKCPKGHFKCMMQQDTQAIIDQANRILDA